MTVVIEGNRLSQQIDYPIGHPKRRTEVLPHLREKISGSIRGHFSSDQADKLLGYLEAPEKVQDLSVSMGY